jgi:hypothetical protein
MDLLQILQGLVIGALAAISIIYTFQTRVPYPTWMLQAYDKPWVFLLMFIASLLLMSQNVVLGALLLLLLAALAMDGLLFARSYESSPPIAAPTAATNGNTSAVEVWPFAEQTNRRLSDPDLYGPGLDTVPLPEPMYPVFYGLHEDVAPGAAPFV